MLDRALFRRFDDVIQYDLPNRPLAEAILRRKSALFDSSAVNWPLVLAKTESLSQADLARSSEAAAKRAVLGGSKRISSEALLSALRERKAAWQ